MTGTHDFLNPEIAGQHPEARGTADDRMRSSAYGDGVPSFSFGNREARATGLQMQETTGALLAQPVSFQVGDNTISGAVAGNKLVTNTGDTYFVHTKDGQYFIQPASRPGQEREPAQQATLALRPNAFSFDRTPNNRQQPDALPVVAPTDAITGRQPGSRTDVPVAQSLPAADPTGRQPLPHTDAPVPQNLPAADSTGRNPVVLRPDVPAPQNLPTADPTGRNPIVLRPDVPAPQPLPTADPTGRNPVVLRPDVPAPQPLPTADPTGRNPVVLRPDVPVPQPLPTADPTGRNPVVLRPDVPAPQPLPTADPTGRPPVLSHTDVPVPQPLPTADPTGRNPVVLRPDVPAPQPLPTADPTGRNPVVLRPDVPAPQTVPGADWVVRQSGTRPDNSVPGVDQPVRQQVPTTIDAGSLPQAGRPDLGTIIQTPRIDASPLPQNGNRIDIGTNGPRIEAGSLPQNGPQNGPRIEVGALSQNGPQNGPRIEVGALSQNEPQNGPRIEVGSLPQNGPQNGPRIEVGSLPQNGPQNGPRIEVGSLSQNEPQNGPRIEVGSLPQNGPQNGPRIEVGSLPQNGPQNGPRIEVGSLPQNGPQNGPRIEVGALSQAGQHTDAGAVPQAGPRPDALNWIEPRGTSVAPIAVPGEKGRTGIEGACGPEQHGAEIVPGGQSHQSVPAGQSALQFDPIDRIWNEQVRVSIHPVMSTDIHGASISDKQNCAAAMIPGGGAEASITPSTQSQTASCEGNVSRRSITGLDLGSIETRQFIGEVIKQLQALKIESSDPNTLQLSQLTKGLDSSKVDRLQEYLVQGMDSTKQLTVAEMISKLTVVTTASESTNYNDTAGKDVGSRKDAPIPHILDATLGLKTTETHVPASTIEPKVIDHSGSAHHGTQSTTASTTTDTAHGNKGVKSDAEAIPTTRPESVKVDLQGVPATRPENVKVDLQGVPATRPETLKIDLQVIPATRPETVKAELDVILSTKAEIAHNRFDPGFTTKTESAANDHAPSTERADFRQNQLSSQEIKNHRAAEEEKERHEREEKRLLAQEAKARQDVALTAIVEQRRLLELKVKAQKEQEKIAEQEKKKQDDNKRRRYVVRHNDTLQSIATTQLRNIKLTSLIHSINRLAIPFEIQDGEPVYGIRVGQVIWLPSNNEIAQAIASITRDELRGKSQSANEELETRFGANWAGTDSVTQNSATKIYSDEELAAIERKRRNIESLLGRLSPKKSDPSERIQYNVRLGDTLKSIALNHPAMSDVSLWKLLAQINQLSTETDAKGSAISKLNRGAVIVLPKQWEIENYRSTALAGKSQATVLGPTTYVGTH